MIRRLLFGSAVVVAVTLGPFSAFAQDAAFRESLEKHGGLTDDEIDRVARGEVVSKVLDTRDKTEVAVFGVVWIEGSMETFVERHKDIEKFETGDAVLAIQKISRPPRAADFANMTFPTEDLRDLANCKVGDCAVKADEQSLLRLQEAVDWSASDAHEKANRVIRQLALEGVTTYLEGGDTTLAAYRDKDRPLYLDREFDRLLENSPYVLEYDQQFHAYLDDFPNAELPGVEEFLYWSKVKFGLKPTVRISHVVIYPRAESQGIEYVIGSKMLYASHYFHTGLELKYLVRDRSRPQANGFYLVSVNRSRSDGLTGFFGGIVRNRAQAGAREGLADALANAKRQLEAAGN